MKGAGFILKELRFIPLGGGNEIGASCYYLEYGNMKIILDCGMRFNSTFVYPDFSPLYKEGIIDGLWELDAVFISHAHLDHVGGISKLFSEGYKGKIFMTPESKAITSLMLPSENIDFLENPNSSYNPNKLISREIFLDRIETLKFGEVFQSKDFSVFFFPAGHILGAAMIAIDTGDYKILYTGDFSDFKQLSVSACRLPDDFRPDVLISESTYGFKNALTDKLSTNKETFLKSVDGSLRSKGSVLLPAFAVGRSQELALYLSREIENRKLKESQIIIDGSSIAASYIYEDYGVNVFNDIVISKNDKERIDKKAPQIIISSSGMLLERSSSSRYALNLLPERKNSIIFTGYLDPDCQGDTLKKSANKKKKTVPINNINTVLKAKVERYSFSAHVNREGIIGLIQRYTPKKVVFVHGFPDKDSSFSLYSDAKEHLDVDAKVFQAFNGSPIKLN